MRRGRHEVDRATPVLRVYFAGPREPLKISEMGYLYLRSLGLHHTGNGLEEG